MKRLLWRLKGEFAWYWLILRWYFGGQDLYDWVMRRTLCYWFGHHQGECLAVIVHGFADLPPEEWFRKVPDWECSRCHIVIRAAREGA